MNRYSHTGLSDPVLDRELHAAVARDRGTTALLLSYLAEFDVRRLHAPAGFPSLFMYCVEKLGFSEDEAGRRIQAARVARRFPVIFDALADGRLHLTAVNLLAAHLTPENAAELLAAAAHRSRTGIERLLAERFPRPDVPEWLKAIAPPVTAPAPEHAPAHVPPAASPGPAAPPEVGLHAPAHVSPPAPAPAHPRVTPLAPERYALQVTISQSTHDKLRHVQNLLSHRVLSGDLAQVLDHALDALIAQLEKRKFAATSRPRPGKSSINTRHIPAAIKRQVWKRDKGRCTFVSPNGRRCESRELPEYDHADPVARGGPGTLSNVRLLCRAHNQHAAGVAFGTEFMALKQEAARSARGSAAP